MVKAMYAELNHTYYTGICRHPPDSKLRLSLGSRTADELEALHEVRMFANVYMCGLQEFCLHARWQIDFIMSDQRGEKGTPCLSKQERRADASTLQTL